MPGLRCGTQGLLVAVYRVFGSSQVVLVVKKKKIACQCRRRERMWVQSLGQEDPLEEGMATHSSILAWKNPTDTGGWWTIVQRVSCSLWDLFL